MRYFIIGIISGLVLASAPFISHNPCAAVNPDWSASLASPESTLPSPFKGGTQLYAIDSGTAIDWFSEAGECIQQTPLLNGNLCSISRDGSMYAVYAKLGKTIEYFNRQGTRFWRTEALEYPYLSDSGNLILLLVSDLSKIHFLDRNGSPTGDENVSGRMCTAISFSEGSDHAAVGFLDGSFALISPKGKILYRDNTPAGTMVKTIAVSPEGKALAVHYGNEVQDGIMTVNVTDKKSRAFALPSQHVTRTALHVNDYGTTAIINVNNFFLFNAKGKILSQLKIDIQKPGLAAIHATAERYIITYRRDAGGSALLICNTEGQSIMSRIFPDETHLDCAIFGNRIVARSSTTVYAWRIE